MIPDNLVTKVRHSMLRSWKLGTAFGIDIYVHWSFLLLPLYVVFSNLGHGSPVLIPYVLTLLMALFGCVVLHELGHALMARRYGIPTRDITLYPIGGVARLERMSERPWEEFWIALAGPAVNVVIAAALLGLTFIYGGSLYLLEGLRAFPTGDIVVDLACMNIALVLFNLLPAFPSDGGRVLRALLAVPLGRLRATEIAAAVGVGMAGLIGLWGLSQDNFMTLFVAGFLVLAGQQELAAVRYRESVRRRGPLTVLPADDDVVDGLPASRAPGFSGFLWDGYARAWVFWRNGRPVHAYRVD
jgi:Zn-dependent protease